jgi:nickel/cobalt transporter (NicO) family protein
MHTTSIPLLLIAAGTVGFLHSILPDHWVPLAVVARTQRWTLARTARTSLLASVGHVLTSIVLGGVIALVGLQFRHSFETEQGHIVGVVLILTGIGFLVWGLTGHGHHHHDHDHHHGSDDALQHPGDDGHLHDHDSAPHNHTDDMDRSLARRLAAIAVPFGAAASPDLTILPVFLAASAVGVGAVIGVLTTFSLITLVTFVTLTVAATLAGYQVQGEWLEDNGNTLTAIVLLVIGIAVYAGL